MISKNNVRLQVTIPRSLFEEFQNECDLQAATKSEAAAEAIRSWITYQRMYSAISKVEKENRK